MTNYIYCCMYYYLMAATKTAAHTLAALGIAFIIHKLVSWALWALAM